MSLRVRTPFPGLDGATGWFNGEPTGFDPHGKYTLVHFWAISCPVCHENLPVLNELHEQFGANLQILHVHRPRHPDDLEVERVKEKAQVFGVAGLCALDNEHIIGDRFQTGGLWPVYFLFGPDGNLKRHAAGGFGAGVVRAALTRSLSPDTSAPAAIAG
jgi:thiol-disulfide isomerase/thioredoxin